MEREEAEGFEMDFLLKILLSPSLPRVEWGDNGALLGAYIETDFGKVEFSFSFIVVSRGGAVEDIVREENGSKDYH